MKKFLFIILTILSCIQSYSQTDYLDNIQYGVALKATIDINGIESKGKYSNFNLSLFGGIGSFVFNSKSLYPSLHAGVVLYNRGELISTYHPDKNFFSSSVLDFMVDISMNVGYFNDNTNLDMKNVPLVHFSDFTSNPLQNPLYHSLTIGSNLIWSTQKGREFQRVGLIGAMVSRSFHISSYNDGGLWGRLSLGDKRDRYYTGGGLLAVYLNNNYTFDNWEFSFHKFTWSEESIFYVGQLLQLDVLAYKDEKSKYYNKGRLRLTARNSTDNYGVHLTLHNTDKDFQDGFHFNQESPFHPDIFKNEKGIRNEIKRAGIGGFYFMNSHNLLK